MSILNISHRTVQCVHEAVIIVMIKLIIIIIHIHKQVQTIGFKFALLFPNTSS